MIAKHPLWAVAMTLGLFVAQASSEQSNTQPTGAIAASSRPFPRPSEAAMAAVEAARAAEAAAAVEQAKKTAGLNAWLRGFRRRAAAQGISALVLDASLAGLRYDGATIARDRNQAEFTKTIWQYLDSAVSEARVANGQAMLKTHAAVLAEIEARYDVPAEVVLAVWGLESAYGSHKGVEPVIQSLATLAHDGRRGAFFEDQLIAALKIIQNGDVDASGMTGSWAGAMGHTQFIPTSYLAYAVDFRGDGKRDIWSDDPTDALASTAAYLARFGWTSGQPWGVEVHLPKDFNYALTGKTLRKPASDWAELGVLDVQGRPVSDHGAASILLPAGAEGAAFMIFGNFGVISRYNAADAYVIGVGHLSDRIAGGAAIAAPWPRGDRALVAAERRELQHLLSAAGYPTGAVDGRIGPKSIAALRRFQTQAGLVADGYPSLKVLEKLR